MVTNLYDAADLYDAMFPSVHPDDLAFYLQQARACGTQVLELACGSGRLTIPLARAGLTLTGLDLNATMLQRARDKAAQEQLDITLVQGDMCAFQLDRQFDMIFIPANSLCHISDWRQVAACLRCVHAHLAPHGRFVFEVFNPSLPILLRDPQQWHAVGSYLDAQGQPFRVSERTHYDTATQINHLLWRAEMADGQQAEYVLTLRMFFPQELEALLEYNQLHLIGRWGAPPDAPFTSTSVRQLVVAEIAKA